MFGEGEKHLDFFERMQIGLPVNRNDEQAGNKIYEWILRKLEEKKTGRIKHNPNYTICNQFHIDYVGKKLIKIIENL